ncbi:hypothetical protein NBM05_01880 [Rothia sp. AR01]|uniref:Uncharacterized protein n=1 Tax=Rothia santali TaxID=2949643 RepID=A0A9X2KK96_9MICC|nr:hypothetical protein [Rothia santali]MCP3424811.1 hypothetical protein [Rothia santali]
MSPIEPTFGQAILGFGPLVLLFLASFFIVIYLLRKFLVRPSTKNKQYAHQGDSESNSLKD